MVGRGECRPVDRLARRSCSASSVGKSARAIARWATRVPPDRSPCCRCSSNRSIGQPIIGCNIFGAISAAGSSTNRRNDIRGCGSVSIAVSLTSLPYSSMSISSVRGAQRSPRCAAVPRFDLLQLVQQRERRDLSFRSQRPRSGTRLDPAARRPAAMRCHSLCRTSCTSGSAVISAMAAAQRRFAIAQVRAETEQDKLAS